MSEREHPPVRSDELLSIKQATKIAECSPMTTYLAIKSGRIATIHVDNYTLIPLSEALYLKNNIQPKGMRKHNLNHYHQPLQPKSLAINHPPCNNTTHPYPKQKHPQTNIPNNPMMP